MEAAAQVRWISEQLRKGITVKFLSPDRYDTQNGFGYTITLMNQRKQFNVILKTKQLIESQKSISMTITAITHYANYKEVEISATELVGKKVILTPSKGKIVNSHYSITGVITLPEEAP